MGAVIELLLGVIFSVALGAAFTMTTSAVTAAEFWIARACFVVAASAAAVAYLVWRERWRSRPISSLPAEIAFGMLAGLVVFIGLPASQYWVHLRELPVLAKASPNFPYLRALLNADKTIKERVLFVENAKSAPIQDVQITFQDMADPTVRRLFVATALYQDGAAFVPVGEARTLRVGAGEYVATMNSLEGEFTEFLSLRTENGALKQKIEVYRLLPSGQSASGHALLYEEE
jgi:hypothetical protein